ncbi:MAG: hypothetical protein CM1200mP14_13250 [Gammaproteobacteria bacterium]|nr:MAG: hypothetical protein CM1200mP14_13250 [Gammaproteobacteria bacterium]
MTPRSLCFALLSVSAIALPGDTLAQEPAAWGPTLEFTLFPSSRLTLLRVNLVWRLPHDVPV